MEEEPEIIEDVQEDFDMDEPILEDDSIQGYFLPKESVYCLDIYKNLVACGSGDDNAYIWELSDGETRFKIDQFKDSVVCCGFSFDGSYCAFGSLEGLTKVVHVPTLTIPDPLTGLEGPSEVSALIWHPKGNVLVVGSEDGTIWMWSIPSGQLMQVFTGHSTRVNALLFGQAGKVLYSISEEGTFLAFNPKNGEAISKYSHASEPRFLEGPLLSLCSVAESQFVLVGNATGSVQLIDSLANRVLTNFFGGHNDSVECILHQEKFKFIITAGLDGRIVFWNMENANVRTCKLLGTMEEPTGITCMKWIDETKFVTGSTDGILRIWDCRSGEVLKDLKGHQDIVLDVAVGEDGKIVSCSDDCTCLVF